MRVRTTNTPAAHRVMPRERQRRPDGRAIMDFRPGERPSERRPVVTDDHIPVMVEEVLKFLAPRPGGLYIDGTLGAGGHSEAILRAIGGQGELIATDRDPKAVRRASFNLKQWGSAVRLVGAGYEELPWLLPNRKADGLLLDLGMSSMQVDDGDRGFSFHQVGPLDMRFDPTSPLTAADIVNGYDSEELIRVLRAYGEERYAARIVRAICDIRRSRPIRTTDELAKIIADAYPAPARRSGHPARKTFQALRIEVNGEFDRLRTLLDRLPDILAPGGRVVILSYHSVEDKIVKAAYQKFASKPAPLPGLPPDTSGERLKILTTGAVLPSELEVARNSRASSARLRAAERTEGK